MLNLLSSGHIRENTPASKTHSLSQLHTWTQREQHAGLQTNCFPGKERSPCHRERTCQAPLLWSLFTLLVLLLLTTERQLPMKSDLRIQESSEAASRLLSRTTSVQRSRACLSTSLTYKVCWMLSSQSNPHLPHPPFSSYLLFSPSPSPCLSPHHLPSPLLRSSKSQPRR